MSAIRPRLALIALALAGGAYLLLRPNAGTAPAQPGSAAPAAVPAVAATAFLDSLGVNTHVDQGYDPRSYVAPLRYTGIRAVRDGARHVDGDLMLHAQTGARFAISTQGDMATLLAAARTLAAAGALLAIEGPNEPNNFPIVYQGAKGGGGGSWMQLARYQQALYAAAKADPALKSYPVFCPSEVGAETDDTGLQFLTVPAGAHTLSPPGTRFCDDANVHNYVSGNANRYADNQAWNAADPTLNARWDGLYGNNGVTWRGHYAGYPASALPALPRVTTETGWDTTINPGGERTQGAVLTNTYLAQFKRGWRYTFLYELRDGEGGDGHQGLYAGDRPKLAATYLHNLTTILADKGAPADPGALAYAIPGAPATVHDLLLRKTDGSFALVVWDERAGGTDDVSVVFAARHPRIAVYDITAGTAPVTIFGNAEVVPLRLSDHAMILEIQ